MAVRVIAFLLVVGLLPAGEMVETGMHVIAYGDLGHDGHGDADDAPLGTDEHGCTPAMHLCGCHTPTPIILSVPAAHRSTSPLAIASSHQIPDGLTDRASTAPPTRPPIV